jgi:glycerol uptake facilitator-like aquaporin
VTPTLSRRCAAEAIGTAFLVACVIGSGIAASRLSDDAGLQLLENSLATGAVLVALILALQPVSASFNPVVTLVECVARVIDRRQAALLVGSQVVGAVLGAITANLMFGLAAVSWSDHHRASGGHLLGEVVATFGLVLVVFGGLRTGRPETVAWSVGAYIAAAYWFTSSTSFANPAVALARCLSDTFAGIAPASVPAFVVAEVVGGAVGAVVIGWLFRSPGNTPHGGRQELTDV